MNEQGQYKDAVRTLSQELKEVKEKLMEANRQNDKLQAEVTDLGQTAGADAVRDFKATQSFIDSCAEYYGTGFDDCLKQVASAFPKLDLFGITMDDGDDGSSQPNPTPESNGVVVLAQPAANLPTPASNTPAVFTDVDNQQADRNPTDVPAPQFSLFVF